MAARTSEPSQMDAMINAAKGNAERMMGQNTKSSSSAANQAAKNGAANATDPDKAGHNIMKAKSSAAAIAAARAQSAQAAQGAGKAGKTISPTPSSGEQAATKVPKTYAMVVSSYENVAKKDELTSKAADQLGETITNRLSVLNDQALREIEALPEFKNLDVDIEDLGEEIADMITDEDDWMKAFALMKSPTFAGMMESSESVHRNFADMMQDNGEEKLMFGALETMSMVENAGKANVPTGISVKA